VKLFGPRAGYIYGGYMDKHGFSIIQVMIATAIALTIGASTLAGIQRSFKYQNDVRARASLEPIFNIVTRALEHGGLCDCNFDLVNGNLTQLNVIPAQIAEGWTLPVNGVSLYKTETCEKIRDLISTTNEDIENAEYKVVSIELNNISRVSGFLHFVDLRIEVERSTGGSLGGGNSIHIVPIALETAPNAAGDYQIQGCHNSNTGGRLRCVNAHYHRLKDVDGNYLEKKRISYDSFYDTAPAGEVSSSPLSFSDVAKVVEFEKSEGEQELGRAEMAGIRAQGNWMIMGCARGRSQNGNGGNQDEDLFIIQGTCADSLGQFTEDDVTKSNIISANICRFE